MLVQASLPLKFWSNAFSTAVFLINRLPTPVLMQKSPIKVLYKVKPYYSTLKVFGCLYFPLLRPFNTNKLDFRSIPCTFLGYSPNHNGYKCLDDKGRLISRHVFNEFIFPYVERMNSTKSSSTVKNVAIPQIPILHHL